MRTFIYLSLILSTSGFTQTPTNNQIPLANQSDDSASQEEPSSNPDALSKDSQKFLPPAKPGPTEKDTDEHRLEREEPPTSKPLLDKEKNEEKEDAFFNPRKRKMSETQEEKEESPASPQETSQTAPPCEKKPCGHPWRQRFEGCDECRYYEEQVRCQSTAPTCKECEKTEEKNVQGKYKKIEKYSCAPRQPCPKDRKTKKRPCSVVGPGYYQRQNKRKKESCPPCEAPSPPIAGPKPQYEDDYIAVTNDLVMPCHCSRSLPAKAGTREGIDFGINIDFILWRPAEAGLGIGVTGATGALFSTRPNGHVLYPKIHKAVPGFKAGVEVNFSHDDWVFNADYTRLIANNPETQFGNDSTENEISAFFLGQVIETENYNANSASGEWRFHFNNINAEIGRNYLNSWCVSFRPFMGLQGGWQDQYLDIEYVYNNQTETLDNQVNFHQKFIGIGPRLGFEMGYTLIENIQLFSLLAAAMLWSSYELSTVNKERGHSTTEPFKFRHSSTSNDRQVSPNLDFQCGFRYSRLFCRNVFRLTLQASWELQVWYGMNQINNPYVSNGSRGDLSMQGLTVRGQIDF